MSAPPIREVRYDGRPRSLERLVAKMARKGYELDHVHKPGLLATPRAIFRLVTR